MFGNWLHGVKKEDKARSHWYFGNILVYWASRNDIIFNKQKGTNFLQVILRAAQWIQLWTYMLPEDQRGIMDTGCSRLLKVRSLRTVIFRLLDDVILVGFEMASFCTFHL
jgi:hypothetical protein